MGSQATRDADGVLYTRAGLEIGVAATKTFVAPGRRACTCLRCSSPSCAGRSRRARSRADRRAASIPHAIDRAARTRSASAIERDRRALHCDAEFFLYLGRHVGLPIALEGALKLKEISYIADRRLRGRRDEARPDRAARRATRRSSASRPTRRCSTRSSRTSQEVRARGAHVIAVATEGNERDRRAHRGGRLASRDATGLLQPLLAVDPAAAARLPHRPPRGLNVDQPRNLAKTVTVE